LLECSFISCDLPYLVEAHGRPILSVGFYGIGTVTVVIGVDTVAAVTVGTVTVAAVIGVTTVTVAATVGLGRADTGTAGTRRIEVVGGAVGGRAADA
jgi:hypothetical protein